MRANTESAPASRAANITRAPSDAKALATASPMPRLAPTTSTDLPFRPKDTGGLDETVVIEGSIESDVASLHDAKSARRIFEDWFLRVQLIIGAV
jgi:hypothetical protein